MGLLTLFYFCSVGIIRAACRIGLLPGQSIFFHFSFFLCSCLVEWMGGGANGMGLQVRNEEAEEGVINKQLS